MWFRRSRICLQCKRTPVRSLGWEDPLEKGMATHSSIFVWRIPWTEEPGRLYSRRSQRVGHNWATNTSWLNEHIRNYDCMRGKCIRIHGLLIILLCSTYHFSSVNVHLQPTGTFCFHQTGSSQPSFQYLVLSLFFSSQGSLCLRCLPCLIFTSFFKI